MNANRALTLTVVIPMLLLVGCGSGPSTATKPRTEAECDGLAERAEGWLEGIPEIGEEGREERRRNACKNAFAYKRGMDLQIESIRCVLDLKRDTMTSKDKQALVSTIKTIEQGIKDNKKYAEQMAPWGGCPGLGD